MQNNSGVIIHLVKLIDAANSSVREDQSSTLQDHFSRFRIFRDVHGKTYGRGALARSVDSPWSYFVDVLKELRLGSGGVSAQKNIDFASESASSGSVEGLAAASEKLAKDSFFHILVLPNAGGERVDEQVVELGTGSKLVELLDLLRSEALFVLLVQSLVHFSILVGILFVSHINVVTLGSFFLVSVLIALAISLYVANNVDFGLENISHCSLVLGDSVGASPVDSHDFNSVTRLHIVNHLFVGAHLHGLRSFSLGHSLGYLLNLDSLAVTEHAEVVDELESAFVVALGAGVRLGDAISLDPLALLFPAHNAAEATFLHLRNRVGNSNDYTLESDELVDVRGVELSDLVGLKEVEGTNLDQRVILFHVHVRVLAQGVLFEIVAVHKVTEDGRGYEIEDRNDICGMILELLVELLVELVQVLAVNVKSVVLSLRDLLHLSDVIRLLVQDSGFIEVLASSVRGKEVAEPHLNIISIDVSSPQNLSVRHFRASHHLHGGGRNDRVLVWILHALHRARHIAELRSVEQAVGVEEASALYEVGHLAWSVQDAVRGNWRKYLRLRELT